MSFSLEMAQMIPAAPRDCYAVPGKPGNSDPLTVVGWEHMDLKLFYPSALLSTWSIRTALYPLAVLRSQLQLQKQNTVYRSTLHAYSDISRREGFRGLYRGFWITVPQIGCSFIYSTIFEKCRAIMHENGVKSIGGAAAVAGGLASFATQSIFVPTDIIAQYMMIYKNTDKLTAGHDKAVIEGVANYVKNGNGLGTSVIKSIYKADGVMGFYRGFWASAAVYIPQMLTFWSSYYYMLGLFSKFNPVTDRSLLIDQAVAATIGGSISTIATNPMELFRVRLQVHRSSYSKTLETMLRDEKTAIFTKGLTPRIIANSIYGGMVVVGYEIVKRLCAKEEHKHRIKW
uniref:Mitochondrial carrier protein n=1 Tax=Caenorhabditis tropicalis TaxID=1561998 RepID=A0A1I7UND0_9PELO